MVELPHQGTVWAVPLKEMREMCYGMRVKVYRYSGHSQVCMLTSKLMYSSNRRCYISSRDGMQDITMEDRAPGQETEPLR